MEYTAELFVRFLTKLGSLDKDIRSTLSASDSMVSSRDSKEQFEWQEVQNRLSQVQNLRVSKSKNVLTEYCNNVEKIFSKEVSDKRSYFLRLQKCKEVLSLLTSAESIITDKDVYASIKTGQTYSVNISIEDLLAGKIDFIGMAYAVNIAIRKGRKKEISIASSKLYSTCRYAEQILTQEKTNILSHISGNRDSVRKEYNVAGEKAHRDMEKEWNVSFEKFNEMSASFAQQKKSSRAKTKVTEREAISGKKNQLGKIIERFCTEFSPEQFEEEYIRLYSLEPSYTHYECVSEMPRNIYISTLEYDLSEWDLCDYTKEFLDRYYYFMYGGNKLYIPYCAQFGQEFNYLFKFDGTAKGKVVSDACNMGIRLFMMLPPGKVNFTFVDPVSLGESFAMFTRLVNIDDRTSEVINGKIWSSPNDIEDKLRIMTDHISNVTQRCLQGKYDNIYEYNKVAEQNAEAYQIIMLMDFPAGLSEQSLRLLEQISTSGPKCGVFTIIYRNETQFSKIPERSQPLVTNIENGFQVFDYSDDAKNITCSEETVKGQPLLWSGIEMPSAEYMDKIIDILKKGIKSADKVVIGIDKVNRTENEREPEEASTKNGIRIPIGLHGANEVQYLTLGVGGSHHALIAGVAGSGKSSLLHTIILQALSQYGPDELRIYLVDFKRGVEFKIYADYKLPSFEVVAIESEREFGYNILKALEREQKIRADRFKRVKERKIDRIEDYRALPNAAPMPRILVIMDEFHELFSNASDKIGKESAEMMERIVRQGRAFGVHIILASQSYSNVGGLDKSVYDQMAVRIVLKCSKTDASLLLGDGSSDVDQISIDDPGRAIYNSEAGNKEYNSHFRVAFIDPSKHREILEGVSERTCKLSNNKTRILLSNIEDNKYSIFNQFTDYDMEACKVPGRLYLGEPLSVVNNLNMDLVRNEYSNMLMVGSDSDKARSMFAFAMLSLAINYWVSHNKKAPEEPFVYFLNYKPLRDDYFIDAPNILATELLTKYVKNIPISNPGEIRSIIQKLYSVSMDTQGSVSSENKYLMVFGYQRAEDLKSEDKAAEKQDIMSMMSSRNQGSTHSMKEMIEVILTMGAQNGIHSVFWQDDFKALDFADRKLITYFYQKIAFDMSKEDYSQFVGVNDISQLGENTAVYNNRIDDTRSFRPYQSPDKEWLETVCESLNQ